MTQSCIILRNQLFWRHRWKKNFINPFSTNLLKSSALLPPSMLPPNNLCHPNLLHSSLQCLNYSSDENRRMSIVNRLATDAGTTTGRIKMAMIIILGFSFLSVSLYNLLGGRKKEDEDTRVIRSVKKNLFKAEKCLKKGNYSRAEEACHAAMAILGSSKNSEKQVYLEAMAIVMDKLANIYLEQKKWKEAELLFKETLRVIIKAGLPQDDDAVIEISLKLARIYHNQKRYDVAESGFHWCVEVTKEKWEKDKTNERYALYGMCLECKARFYLMFGHHASAVKDFSELLDIAKTIHGPTHLQVAVCCNNLATAFDASKQYSRAVDLVSQSLKIAESLQSRSQQESGDDDSVEEARINHYIPIFYINLGNIHSNNGEFDSAVLAYDKAELFAKKSEDKQVLLDQVNVERKKLTSHTKL